MTTPILHERIIRKDFESAFELLRKPEGLLRAKAVESATGCLALHLAAGYIHSSFDGDCVRKERENMKKLILLLLECHPHGVQSKDKKGELPLHYACRRCPERVRTLFEVFPKGAEIPGKFGKLPIHLASECLNGSAGIIQLLGNQFPEGIRHPDYSGRLPIHWILANTKAQTDGLEALEYLYQRHPTSLMHRDNEGNLPIHLAAGTINSYKEKHTKFILNKQPSCAKEKDLNGNLPIHRAVHLGEAETAVLLANAFPKGLLLKNKGGKIPIHFCCGKDDAFFASLAKTCPQSLKIPDPSTGILPAVHHLLKCKMSVTRAHIINKALVDAFNSGEPNAAGVHNPEERRRLLDQIKQQENDKLALKKHLKHSVDQMKRQKLDSSAELEQLEQRLDQLENQKKGHLVDEQLGESLEVYKKLASHARKLDKILLSGLEDPDNKVTMDELKSVANSIKQRIDTIKAHVAPKEKPSTLQALFRVFITNPDITRPDLVDCIQRLDAELTGLEADLEDGLGPGGCPEGNETAIPLPATTRIDNNVQAEPDAAASRKRSRVSLP